MNKFGISAKVIEHSFNEHNVELLTMQLRYPRFIHSEFMTHRVLSRNASSSRAIPVQKMLDMVRKEPAMPVEWGMNQPGMQAGRLATQAEEQRGKGTWMAAASLAASAAEELMMLGFHKQICNRLIEPFQFINVVVTATEWDNFFELRDHEAADPTIHELARVMRMAKEDSRPVLRVYEHRDWAMGWHLPYITHEERAKFTEAPIMLAKMSSARCARTSYLTHDMKEPSVPDDLGLFNRLAGEKPIHASPTEHAARVSSDSGFTKNFRGWHQFRCYVEAGLA